MGSLPCFEVFIFPHSEGGYRCDNDLFRVSTGFSGSTALAVWASSKCGLFVDARYTLQAQGECPGFDVVECRTLHPQDPQVTKWIRQHVSGSSSVATDFRRLSVADFRAWTQTLPDVNFVDIPAQTALARLGLTPHNIPLQHKKPPLVECYSLKYAGLDDRTKLQKLRDFLASQAATSPQGPVRWGFWLTSPEEIAWLLNLRAQPSRCSPTFPASLYLTELSRTLFVPAGTQFAFDLPTERPGLDVIECAPQAMEVSLATLLHQQTPDILLYVPDQTPQRFVSTFPSLPLREVTFPPERQFKASAELVSAREIHLFESAALIRWLAWITSTEVPLSEMAVAQKLEEFRQQNTRYKSPSFPSIIATGAHSAIVHYVPSQRTNARLGNNDLLLLDVGGHYLGGTTDMTRTLWLGSKQPPYEVRQAYTAVLRGHIALARQAFPASMPGCNLDAFARQFLWENGWDYHHGTGHGVGNYLAVHEGPVGISPRNSTSLQASMIVSIEPGVYFKGRFGIRLENLYEIAQTDGRNEPFLHFRPLTFVPFDSRCVDVEQLTTVEKEWLLRYHEQIARRVGPLLLDDPRTVQWLKNSVQAFV